MRIKTKKISWSNKNMVEQFQSTNGTKSYEEQRHINFRYIIQLFHNQSLCIKGPRILKQKTFTSLSYILEYIILW